MEKDLKKATLLLLFQLLFSLAAGFFCEPLLISLVLCLGFLLPLLVFRPSFSLKGWRGGWPLLFLLPLFLFINGLTSTLTAWFFGAVGLPLTPVLPNENLLSALLFDVLLTAFCEEIFCRGMLYDLLRPLGAGTAIFGSALAFSLMHGNLYQLFYAFIAGLLLALLREVSGSFLLPFLFHLCNNLTSLLSADVEPWLFLGASLGLSLLGLLLFWRHRGILPSREELKPRKLRPLFASPFTLYLLLMLLISLL